ncbi:MAG TPA: GAF domain-containing protein [Patescibacteria group bacterium]|nr:GAF domain-containing protein [Patescibacteria group bacterium]
MKIAHVVADLLTSLSTATSVQSGLDLALRRLLRLSGADAGALEFDPPRGEPIVVVAGGARGLSDELEAILLNVVSPVASPDGAVTDRRRRRAAGSSRGARARPGAMVRRIALGPTRRPVGRLVLIGSARRLGRLAVPPEFGRELGAAIEPVWRLQQRTLRMTVLNEITRLLVSSASLDDVLSQFADGLARLVRFDALAVALLDRERGEFEVLDVLARAAPRVAPRDVRMALDKTLLAQLVTSAEPIRVDDVSAAAVPEVSRRLLAERGYSSALLVPLVNRDGVFGSVTLAARARAAFDDTDVEVTAELARPLASAIEQRRLLDESRRRAEELAALFTTSQLITARLDVASVLDRISRAVTALIGSTGCGIGLLDSARTRLVHAAAHGFQSEEWRGLALPVGEGIIGRCAETGVAIRVDDVRTDPRSARRDVDEREGIRSMLCVPLRAGSNLRGVISAFSTRAATFTSHHQRVLEAFAEQAGIAIHNAQLFEQSLKRAQETRALFEAGRAVTQSLDVNRTIRVILEQARAVLGVASCGILTLDPVTRELTLSASLDLPEALVDQVRIPEGEGIAGRAVRDLRPRQSADLVNDPRVRHRELPLASGLRATLAAPLRVGDRAIGALEVFHKEVHQFTAAEEEMLVALADQAAIALEHARLYQGLEAMVAERTRELDGQKRFVEVVLETLPLGVFVLDAELAIVRANRDGARTLGCDPDTRVPFAQVVPDANAASVQAFLRAAFGSQTVTRCEEEFAMAGELKQFRLTTAPLPGGDEGPLLALLVEDITLAKQLERQMLLTERLTTAGRLAAGVAHELNNPLATIAGCAESLQSRLKEAALAGRDELADFPTYLGLVEEEAFRCKEITGSLLQFVREPGSRRTSTDVNGLVDKTIELLSRQARYTAGRFATELDGSLSEVTLNEGQLRQVFLGLGSNAMDAMDGHGCLTIRTRRARHEIEIEFEDEGPGIPEEIAARIWDPFFTTKPPGQGTGLGLAIAQGIVADHGGRIEMQSHVGKGSIFRVVLPA